MSRFAFCLALLAIPQSETVSQSVRPHPNWVNTLAPSGEPGPLLTLATEGIASYRIAIPETPSPQERKAADELGRWLEEMTGASFPIVQEGEDFRAVGREISVGETRLLAEAEVPEKNADLGNEGYAIAVERETLFLFGGKWRGPIYAVLALLEEDLGCRWYARGTATIPSRPTLQFRPVPRTFVPRLERRDPYYSDAHDRDWSLRNRTSSHHVPIPAGWGGYPKFPMHFVHTYNLLMPPDEFFETHPEYYSEIEGQRTPSQLCPTHPDVIRIMTERVLEKLRTCPDCRYVDVSPNDWRGYCECPVCHELDAREGSYSASLLTLVNAVAEVVEREYPGVQVTTLAYLGTFMPPKSIRPRENVQIVLCTDSHAWDSLFLDVTETSMFYGALQAWSRIGARMKIWDYTIDLYRYMRPTPNMEVVARNIRTFVEHGAVGVFAQGSHGGNFGVDRSRLRTWVWSKLMWDVSRDSDALIRDFYYGYYGEAAPFLYEYDRMLHHAWENAHAEWTALYPESHMPEIMEYQRVFFPHVVDFGEEFVTRAFPLFAEAEAQAGENRELRTRIEYAKLSLQYLQAERGPNWAPYRPTDQLILLNEFERVARRENAVFTRDAYMGPDLNRRLRIWRAIALMDPAKIGSIELSNEWKFRPDPKNLGIEEQWHSTHLDDSDWGTVRSDLGWHRGWESQGYEEYMVGYGWYRQWFHVPEEFANVENPRLFFAQVDEQAEIFINGQHALSHSREAVGLSKDFLWLRPFLFDPFPQLKAGEKNLLAVRVKNEALTGGIVRPVYLLWGEPEEDIRALIEFLELRKKRENSSN